MTRRPPPRPIITLTSDFGLRDAYVAVMKAAVLRLCPEARLIDVTHDLSRHDILGGSICLERAIDGFPAGTTHLAVVDPGVGTARRILVATFNDHTVICPDNGLITWAWRQPGSRAAYELTWRPSESSTTFHGRDIMGPAAAMLACRRPLSEIAVPISDPFLLDLAPVREPGETVRIIHVDHFGNATTNISHAVLRQFKSHQVRVRDHDLGGLHRTYWDVEPGRPLALIGSSGLLEIAVRDGSAAEQLQLHVGDEVDLT